jgi:ribosomal protein S18 acetylase RimI-like enzyme
MSLTSFRIVELEEQYRDWARRLLISEWGGGEVVSHGQVHDVLKLPGYVALLGEEPAGLVTYHIRGSECELITLNSLEEGIGIGSALVKRVAAKAQDEGCRRLWLITTNDNTKALRFYQINGFRLAALRRGAIENSRKLKPLIPLIGIDGIPIRDEIELEMGL